MNCNTCRYELSQCLDGRLPSGRRAVVMQHVDGCEVCSAFWAELQAAQQLTLQLPKERVSAGVPADFHPRNLRQRVQHLSVHRIHHFTRLRPARDIGLVGHYDEAIANRCEADAPSRHVFIKFEIS